MNQFFLAKAGFLLGPVTSVVMALLIGYSMYLIVKVADDLESKKENIENFDKITKKVFGTTFRLFTKFCCFMFNYCCLVVNMINFGKFLQE